MSNTKSARKRIKISERNSRINRSYKSKIKTFTKQYLNVIKENKNIQIDDLALQKIQVLLRLTISYIDKAAKKKVYHKNAAARKKSKLQKLYNTLA